MLYRKDISSKFPKNSVASVSEYLKKFKKFSFSIELVTASHVHIPVQLPEYKEFNVCIALQNRTKINKSDVVCLNPHTD